MSIHNKLTDEFIFAEENPKDTLRKDVPSNLADRIDSWKFGKYGWTSPPNLFITAAWYKWLNHDQDTCKIWSKDSQKVAIPGGFSIRTVDEKYTVPLVTKTSITSHFCSPNSGMQGTRAIEKMRESHRIERNTIIQQKVAFDMPLFQNIMNDINDCSESEALATFRYLLRIGIEIRENINAQHNELASGTIDSKDINLFDLVFSFINNNPDPQFNKAVAVALLEFLIPLTYEDELTLQGVDGSKTAADTQSKAPGDFWYEDSSSEPFIAVEVKDQSKQIGFDIINAVKNRKANNPTLKYYFLISANINAVSEDVLSDKYWVRNISELYSSGLNLHVLSMYELFSLANHASTFQEEFINKVNEVLVSTRDLKKDTIKNWTKEIS